MTGERLIFGDVETTGLDVDKDRIVEIALIEAIDAKATGKTLHLYINPERDMPEDASDIHGLTTDFLSNKPIFADIADEVIEFMRGAVFVGHNAVEFDAKILKAEFARLGLQPSWSKIEDTLHLARRKFEKQRNTLDALMKRFGIDDRERVRHGAMIDTKLLIEVYAHLTGKTTLDLSNANHVTEVDGAIETVLMPAEALQSWFPYRGNRDPSDDEMERHREFVTKNIKNPLWTPFFELNKMATT